MKVKTASRFYDLQEKHQQRCDVDGTPLNKMEPVTFHNRWGQETCVALLNWKNGFLSDDPDEGIPAVQMDDMHIEHWENGYISQKELDPNGNVKPAVYDDWGKTREYWVNGKRVG